VNPDETRKFLDDALSEFRAAGNPDSRLRSLWKISQLAENTTDEELYELASAVAVEEDYRLRGEICYTISRSQRPQLIRIVRGMIRDENPYVRRSAITALGELGGVSEAMLAAIEPILDDVDNLRTTVTNMEEKLLHLRSSVEVVADIPPTSSPEHEIVMDDNMRCWETYLRHERELLLNHKGEYVAIYGDKIVGVGEDEEKLAEVIYKKYGPVSALICKIEEEDEPISMPPPREIIN